MLLALAWRNLWRNRRRSAILATAIVLGMGAGQFATAFMTGMSLQMVETAINRELGHVQIHAPGFTDDRSIALTIPAADSVLATTRRMPGVAVTTPRALIQGMIASPVTSQGVTIVAIDPATEARVTSVARSIVEGAYLDDMHANTIVIGRRLAHKLESRLRGKLVLSFAGPDGTITYLACRVAGVFETESSLFDDNTIFIRRTDLGALLGRELVHAIVLRTTPDTPVDTLAAHLRGLLPGLKIETWKERSPEMKLYSEITDLYAAILVGVILFALLFGITNTMLMSVLDRMREFGVLLAVGMRRRRLYRLIVLESFLLAAGGSLVGCGVGSALVAFFHAHGIRLGVFTEGLAYYGISTEVHPELTGVFYAYLTVMIAVTATCAAVYPGWKAAHIQPVEAIRGG